MAPATVAGARTRVTTRVQWDRENVINAIREWVATYGEPPRAADWNPSSAKWSGQTWRIERYRAGRADGSPWPALNSAKRPFGGSLNEAIRAAGFEPARPGPKRRTDVQPAQADRVQMDPEARALLMAARAEAREAVKRVESLEAQLERQRERADRLVAERDAARRARRPAKPKVERVVDARAVKRAEAAEAKATAAVSECKERTAEARMDAAEARQMAGRLAGRLERAEATVATLRGERRDLKAALDRASDREQALERLLEAARVDAERKPDVVRIREEAPEASVVREALDTAARDRRAAEAAEVRAARAERELRETVAAVKGESRKLTPAELAELRATGPAGPSVMAHALQELAAARKGGNPTRMAAALGKVAEAAVTWQERL